jgi:hypothetical protein
MAEEREKVKFKDFVELSREETSPAHYKEELDAAISRGRRIRKSDERTNLMLCLVEMRTNKLALSKHLPASPLADAMSSMDVAKELQTFQLDNGVEGTAIVPFRESRVENIERLVNRNIEQGLITKNINEKGEYEFINSVALEQPANYCISPVGLGYLQAQNYNTVDAIKRLIQHKLIESVYEQVPIKSASEAGFYETKWGIVEEVYNDVNATDKFVDTELLANAEKSAKLAAAIAEKDWAYCYTEKENKDQFVRWTLAKFNLPDAILTSTVNTIDPTQKGGRHAARRIRDAIADIWRDELESKEAALTHVQEMILRDSWLTLRSTFDKQTGLMDRAEELQRYDGIEDLEEELIELESLKGPSDQEQAFVADRVRRVQIAWQNFQVVEQQSRELLNHYKLTQQLGKAGQEEYPNGLEIDYHALSCKTAEVYMDEMSRDPNGWEWNVRDAVSEFNLALDNLMSACMMLGMDTNQVAILNPLAGLDEKHSFWIMHNNLQVTSNVPIDYRVS